MTVFTNPLSAIQNRIGENPSTRNQLRLVTVAWMFGAVWMMVASGLPVNVFTKQLGAPEWGYGLLAAMIFFGALMRVPASYIIERYGKRREIFLITLSASRMLWIAAGLMPFMLSREMFTPLTEALVAYGFSLHEVTSNGDIRWIIMLSWVLLAWGLDGLGNPCWMHWMNDVIPRRVRGRYFAIRDLSTKPILILALPLIGVLMDAIDPTRDLGMLVDVPVVGVGLTWLAGYCAANPDAIILITGMLVAFAGLLGVLDIQFFHLIPDQPHPGQKMKFMHWVGGMAGTLRDRAFLLFLAYTAVFMLAMGFLGQYVFRFVDDRAQFSNIGIMVLVGVVPMAIGAFGAIFWGSLIDRIGYKPALVIAGTLIVMGPWGWFIVTPQQWVLGYLMTCISPFAFSGVNLAAFNMVLARAGSRTGDKRAGSSSYVAMHGLVWATAGIGSGLLGAFVAGQIEGFELAIPVMGAVLTYHHVLFVISSGLRATAMLLSLGLPSEKGVPMGTAWRAFFAQFPIALGQIGSSIDSCVRRRPANAGS